MSFGIATPQGLRHYLTNITVIPERPLPAADPAVVITEWTEPQHIEGIDVEKERQQPAARAPAWPAPATQRGRLIVIARLGYYLRPKLGESQPATREWRKRSIWLEKMREMNAPVVAHDPA
jgi:hypothetical protein